MKNSLFLLATCLSDVQSVELKKPFFLSETLLLSSTSFRKKWFCFYIFLYSQMDGFQNYLAQQFAMRWCVVCMNQVSSSNIRITLCCQLALILLFLASWRDFAISWHRLLPQRDSVLCTLTLSYLKGPGYRGQLATILGCILILVSGISQLFGTIICIIEMVCWAHKWGQQLKGKGQRGQISKILFVSVTAP